MQKTLAELAKIVEGEVVGDKNLVITGLSGIEEASEGDLTFLISTKYLPLVKKTKASAIVAPRDLNISGKALIQTDNPSLAFGKIAALMIPPDDRQFKGIHKTAVVADDAVLGKNVSLGPYVVVESKAKIGDHTIVYPHVYVGPHTSIGKNCLIYPNVSIYEITQIGNRVIIHSGTVIGSDGFGYEQEEGAHKKIPQLGIVVVEDDVEIGANVTIDRARLNKTVIGKGTKIDNLVQIGHNVILGENCIIISQVGISGSSKVGKNSVLAGQAGIAGHITIGESVMVAAQSGVSKDVPSRTNVLGYPARPMAQAQRIQASLHLLPRYIKTIHALEKRVAELGAKLKGKAGDSNK